MDHRTTNNGAWNAHRVEGVVLLVVLAVTPMIFVGCGGTAPSAPTSVSTTAAQPAAPAAPAPTAAAPAGTTAPAADTTSGPTAGQLADTGQNVYAANCAGCHGDKGQGVTGPALIGASATYGRFSSAQQVYNYIFTAMPLNNPGSLAPDQAMQVTSYILVQNGFVQRSAPLNSASLGNVPLKKQ